jgi:hypothetical protein
MKRSRFDGKSKSTFYRHGRHLRPRKRTRSQCAAADRKAPTVMERLAPGAAPIPVQPAALLSVRRVPTVRVSLVGRFHQQVEVEVKAAEVANAQVVRNCDIADTSLEAVEVDDEPVGQVGPTIDGPAHHDIQRRYGDAYAPRPAPSSLLESASDSNSDGGVRVQSVNDPDYAPTLPDGAEWVDDTLSGHDDHVDDQAPFSDTYDIENQRPIREHPSDREPTSSLPLQLLYLLSLWRVVFRIPRVAYTALLKIVTLIFMRETNPTVTLTPHTVDARIGVEADQFTRTLTCVKCWTMYKNPDSLGKIWSDVSVHTRCSAKSFASSTGANRRMKCNERLTSRVKRGGRIRVAARMTTPGHSLLALLQKMIARPGFLNQIGLWRQRPHVKGVYADIYDGAVWREMRAQYGDQFAATGTATVPAIFLHLSLNVDWFQPFKHVNYSVGVVYWSIQNLPRAERYKPANVLITHIIPGGKEAGISMTNLMQWSVSDLVDMWVDGGAEAVDHLGRRVRFKAALTLIACDQPAARKVCGFVAHCGIRSCMRYCLWEYPRFFLFWFNFLQILFARQRRFFFSSIFYKFYWQGSKGRD